VRHLPACCVHETACAEETAKKANASHATGAINFFTVAPQLDTTHPSDKRCEQ